MRRVLEEKYGFDRLFDWLAGRVVRRGQPRACCGSAWTPALIDGAVNGTAARGGARPRAGCALVQTGLVRAYALLILGGAVVLLGYLLWMR